MVPDTDKPASHTSGEPGSYSEVVVAAYASAMYIHLDDITEADARKINQALIAHAHSDAEASSQAGLSIEQIHHDRTTLDALNRLPLLIIATAAGTTGRFYFSRPIEGWPRPGFRHPG